MLCFAVKSQVKPRDSIDQLFEFAILLFFFKESTTVCGDRKILMKMLKCLIQLFVE